jgi:hypothetical protein
MLTAERLRELLHYDPETGVFTWRARRSNFSRYGIGDVAGCVNPVGYRRIGWGKTYYPAHRLAWLYMTGEWPSGAIDHINCVKDDNRLANLRVATTAQNRANARKSSNNTSGFKGVVWHRKMCRWMAGIKVNGRSLHLGYFDCPAEAHTAYVKAAKEHFGEFARVT